MSTPRFDLETYQQGDDNWSHTDTVELLDELAVETDTISNRPTSGNYDDELFFATDQKLLYRWDSGQSDWLIEGGIGNSSNRLPSLWADTVNSNVTKHATDISEDYVVDSGEGAVFSGPITGSGSISGGGQVSVIQEGTVFTDNVDAQGNDINNVGALEADAVSTQELNNGIPRVFRELETGSVDGGDSITIDGFSLESTTGTFKEYWLYVDCLSRVAGDVTLQVNGIVGDYEFFDESGTRHRSQDEFYLFEDGVGTSNTVVAGWIKISDPASSAGRRWGILNNLTFGRRVSGYSQRGGVDDFNDITSISINLAGAEENNEITVSVFEVTPNV